MPEIHTLTLRETRREGGGGKTARTYLDFYVPGRRLLDLLDWPDADFIAPLGWGPVEAQISAIGELLRRQKPSLSSGRCQLYICPECADIACGAVTARVEREADFVVWRDFAFENGYEDPRLYDLTPLHFDATAYEQTLSSFRPDETRVA
jgi:hypothetical protein